MPAVSPRKPSCRSSAAAPAHGESVFVFFSLFLGSSCTLFLSLCSGVQMFAASVAAGLFQLGGMSEVQASVERKGKHVIARCIGSAQAVRPMKTRHWVLSIGTCAPDTWMLGNFKSCVCQQAAAAAALLCKGT